MRLDQVEGLVGAIGIIGIAVALVAIFWGLWLSLSRAPGRRTGSPGIMLNGMFYLVAGALYFGLCYVLWRPLPIDLGLWLRLFVLALGSALLFSGLILVTWGRFALGRMYNVSSGFGVQLYEDQRLVTDGPFAIVRHPMYLGILLVALGGILVYKVWTFAFLLGNFPGLIRRARLEEEALAMEFGELWDEYIKRVPALIPRLRRFQEDEIAKGA
jgi:protein-S-isoprenylcysteine O-methyltransferase Ste14